MIKTVTSSNSIKGYTESTIAKSETNDCSVRAIANAFDVHYDEAHRLLANTYGRRNRGGVSTYSWHTKNDNFSDKGTRVFGKKMVKIEYPEVVVEGKRCTQRATWYDNTSKSYKYKKKLKLYTKRGKKYSQMTVGAFIKKYQTGTFILSVKGHTFTIKDGVVFGNYSDNRLRVRVEKAWEVK